MTDDIDGLRASIETCKEKISALSVDVAGLKIQMAVLVQSNSSLETILKYVVTPLIAIVGIIVGVKLVV